jgi:hypothetical protein
MYNIHVNSKEKILAGISGWYGSNRENYSIVINTF